MATRWNKPNRVHTFAFPLDSLVKEKENTNRPIAAQSAGTVGKWGTTSFTSIRTSAYSYASFSPKQGTINQNISPHGSDGGVGIISTTAIQDKPKPKKFFKSRNVVPSDVISLYHQLPQSAQQNVSISAGTGSIHHQYTNQLASSLQQQQQHQQPPLPSPQSSSSKVSDSVTPKIRLKINKKLLKSEEVPSNTKPKQKNEKTKTKKQSRAKEKPTIEKPIKIKVIEKPTKIKAIEKPTRILSRTRKAVNYSENVSRSPSPEHYSEPTNEENLNIQEEQDNNEEQIEPVVVLSLPIEHSSSTPCTESDVIHENQQPSITMKISLPPPPPQPSMNQIQNNWQQTTTATTIENDLPTPESPVYYQQPTIKTSPVATSEHPPIVLRISKGTSRLISTDSEEIHSPPYLSPPTPNQFIASPAVKSTAELLAVLSDNHPSIQTLPPTTTTTEPSPSHNKESIDIIQQQQQLPSQQPSPQNKKSKSLKIKIKTSLAQAYLQSNGANDELKTTFLNEQSSSPTKATLASASSLLLPPPPPPPLPPQVALQPAEQMTVVSLSTPAQSLTIPSPKPSPPLKRSTRLTRRNRLDEEKLQKQQLLEQQQQQQAVAIHSAVIDHLAITMKQQNSPQPGNVNYELYRTLAASPTEDKDFDSQSSIHGSISSIFVPPPEDSQVIRSHGSSNVTTASDQDTTSQDSSLVAPPSDVDDRLAAMMECDTDTNASLVKQKVITPSPPTSPSPPPPQKIAPSPVTKRRVYGKRQKAKSPSPSKETTPPPPPAELIEKLTDVIEQEQLQPPPPPPPQVPVKEGRVTRTRNQNNGNVLPPPMELIKRPPVTKSYRRKRKVIDEPIPMPSDEITTTTDASHIEETTTRDMTLLQDELIPKSTVSTRSSRTESKRSKLSVTTKQTVDEDIDENADTVIENYKNVNNNFDIGTDVGDSSVGFGGESSKLIAINEDEKPPAVKLVISKKKGSIFKSRATAATTGESTKPKRHLYRHKWDDDDDDENKEKPVTSDVTDKKPKSDNYFDEFDDEEDNPIGLVEPTGQLTRVKRARHNNFESTQDDDEQDNVDSEQIMSVRCDTKAKDFYTVVRNVKKAHQMQEIGEFQEMKDDVDYILDALQPHNPMATRCLSAIQLASKCMAPAFRMHVRAHGTITKFFKALYDAKKTQSLGLCTATVMFVLNQDHLNMDLDRDSLELMLNLLESDVSHQDAFDDCDLSQEQLLRNKQKVKEICADIKSQGKAVHLNLDNITVGTLAMETLLSLTSKRAGEWFKEELRTLGGLEKIIDTICECCHQISDYVVDWTDSLLEKLRKIERCLRVLENVTTQNEENQTYILQYRSGHAIDSLVKFYKLCDQELSLYPTNDQTPKNNPGVVLREALVPTLKVLINLTHPFCTKAMGSVIIGEHIHIFSTSLHLLLQATLYVPERCIFELSLLVLLLLINLTTYTMPNRVIVMDASAPSDFGSEFNKTPAIKALIEYFYKYEELARMVEQNTDAILENPKKNEKGKGQSQEDVDETVTKLLQKAGNHMEHTMIASYASLLIGYLIREAPIHQKRVREFLKNGSFTVMVQVLEKYYTFLNLTSSSEASAVAHIKQTKMIIEYFQKCDSNTHSKDDNDDDDDNKVPTGASTTSVYKNHLRGHNSNTQSTSSSNTTTSSSYTTANNSSTHNSFFSSR